MKEQLKDMKLSIRVTPDEYRRIERAAEALDLPMAYLVRRAVRDYLEEHPCRASDALTD